MARVSVRVATRDDADAHFVRCHEDSAIADGIATFKHLYGNNFAGERHHRFQSQRRGAVIHEGGRTIERNAGAHPIAVRLRVPQQCSRIGGADLKRLCAHDVARHFFATKEFFQLLGDTVFAICIGEMRHQRDLAKVFAARGHAECVTQSAISESESVHAGIDLDEHVERMVKFRLHDRADLRALVHGRRQAMSIEYRQFLFVEKSFEHEDGLGDAELT